METYKFKMCGGGITFAEVSIEAENLAAALAAARKQVKEVKAYSHTTRIMHGRGVYNS